MSYKVLSQIVWVCLWHGVYAQCPYPAAVSTTSYCVGATLTVTTDYSLAQIVWVTGPTVVKLVIGGNDRKFVAEQPGMYRAVVTNTDGCTVSLGPLTINGLDSFTGPPLIISSPDTAICSGAVAIFTSTLGGGGADISYRWQVNGANSGTDSTGFSSSGLVDGDVVFCVAVDTGSCVASISNPVTMIVYTTPFVSVMPVVSVPLGQSVVLNPAVSGDIVRYSWTPTEGLSDSHIPDPVARPAISTVYNLTVQTAQGCVASGSIVVDVFSPIRIPGAFTPNGDGRNDVFYVLGGPVGSRIDDFSIFNRWGQRVFQRTDIAPGDPAQGWDGNYKGIAAQPGTYVYLVVVLMTNGTNRIYRGTVVLVR
jgi:gliding motility-associated-like protein